MAQYTGTFDAFAAVGIREDLSDVIYMLKPIECPLMTAAGRSKATQTKHEWQSDSLAAYNLSNASIEGDDAPSGSVTATQRHSNLCQISTKVVVISGTLEVSEKAGRSSEVGYQVAKKGLELKRDIEAIASQKQESDNGSTTPGVRLVAAYEAWMTTNDYGTPGASPANRGSSGANSYAPSSQSLPVAGTSAITDGTLRNLDEAILKGVLQKVYSNGGHPSLLIAPPLMKQRISGFSGNNVALQTSVTKFQDIEGKALNTAIDVYISDFGTLNVQPSRFCRTRSVLVVDPEYIAFAYLRPFQAFPLAKTGDAEKRELLAEWTLEMRNEAAQGVLADLQ
jgi:hypothetical protein